MRRPVTSNTKLRDTLIESTHKLDTKTAKLLSIYCISLDKTLFQLKRSDIFLYLHANICCGTHKNRLNEALLMSTAKHVFEEN